MYAIHIPGTTSVYYHIHFQKWALEIELRSSRSQGKHITYCVISLVCPISNTTFFKKKKNIPLSRVCVLVALKSYVDFKCVELPLGFLSVPSPLCILICLSHIFLLPLLCSMSYILGCDAPCLFFLSRIVFTIFFWTVYAAI